MVANATAGAALETVAATGTLVKVAATGTLATAAATGIVPTTAVNETFCKTTAVSVAEIGMLVMAAADGGGGPGVDRDTFAQLKYKAPVAVVGPSGEAVISEKATSGAGPSTAARSERRT